MTESDVDEILAAIDEIDAIATLDMVGLEGSWKQHLDNLYRRVQLIRAICENDDNQREASRILIGKLG